MNKGIFLRLKAEDDKRLTKIADKRGVSRPEAIRELIREAKV